MSQNCSLLHFCLSIENALEVLKWLKSALSVVVPVVVTVVVSVTTKDIPQHLTFYPEKIFLFQLLYNFNRDNCCNCNIYNSNIRIISLEKHLKKEFFGNQKIRRTKYINQSNWDTLEFLSIGLLAWRHTLRQKSSVTSLVKICYWPTNLLQCFNPKKIISKSGFYIWLWLDMKQTIHLTFQHLCKKFFRLIFGEIIEMIISVSFFTSFKASCNFETPGFKP